jgi:hypothetical protein
LNGSTEKDDGDDSSFDALVDDIYDKLDNDYKNKVDAIMAEQNITEKEHCHIHRNTIKYVGV